MINYRKMQDRIDEIYKQAKPYIKEYVKVPIGQQPQKNNASNTLIENLYYLGVSKKEIEVYGFSYKLVNKYYKELNKG